VGIINREALEERARKLYTVPTKIAAAVFSALNVTCRTATLPPLYSFNAVTNQHELIKLPHQLTAVETFSILSCLDVPNGIKFVQVTLVANKAELDVHFFNKNYLSTILTDAIANPGSVKTIFPITGGFRVPAGQAAGQVQVTQINAHPDPAQAALILTVEPIGDYSTYTLGIDTLAYPNIDPLFSEITFKFRPGCFNTNCAPEWEPGKEKKAGPVIDYLAKDYDSFRHTMIAAMMERVPSWEGSSEADLDQVLLELFSAAADELSDYQDRVMNEAYLASVRKRVSLARHSRLMDYHIHQGNQASTWEALEVVLAPPPALNQLLFLQTAHQFWAGNEKQDELSVVFLTRSEQPVHPLVNRFGLYTWDDSVPSLEAGSITADLKIIGNPEDQATATRIQNLIRAGAIKYLLIQEYLNPATGTVNGRNSSKRQLLRLLTGNAGAKAMYDPLTGPPATAKWFVRVNWREEDRLQSNYCFTVECPQRVEDVSLFHGNLVQVHNGRPTIPAVAFKEPSAQLNSNEFHYEPTAWGTVCRLPDTLSPLAYLDTLPGGDVPPLSTLTVNVVLPGGTDEWDEVPNLIHSDASDENGDHYVVETDENGRSLVRFGNGVNGKKLPEAAEVHCEYQYGNGLDGNIGLDTLINFDPAASAIVSQIGVVKTLLTPAQGQVVSCWNPFDVTNGRSPEAAAEIIRRVPEAYRARQLRAVTLSDYVNRAREVPGVSRAAASYAWTGSWRTVRITIDPVGTTGFSDELRRDVTGYLEAVRLIGEDLELRAPRFVPLDIRAALCADPNTWPEDLRFVLEQEFSAGFTPDGRMGFFHPDLWTFGQPLRTSQIIGRIQSIEGVEHVISVTLRRWNETTPAGQEITNLQHNEIIRVTNDPDHLELGFIFFDVQGGRR